MIAVDTNVLLRYLLRDDETQADKSRQVFKREECILITDVVLAEIMWTLSGRKYKATKIDLIAVVNELLQEQNVRFEDDEVIVQALNSFRKSDADFADALIVHKALKIASKKDELEAFYTFDTAALRLPNTKKP